MKKLSMSSLMVVLGVVFGLLTIQVEAETMNFKLVSR